MNADGTMYEILSYVSIAVGSLYVAISIVAGVSMLLKQETLTQGQQVGVDKVVLPLLKVWTTIARVAAIFGNKLYPKRTNAGRQPIPKRFWHRVTIPPFPPAFMPIPENLVSQCDAVLTSGHKLLLTGPSGMGKTTVAIETCRRYKKLNGASPLQQLPVYLSLAQPSGKLNQYPPERGGRLREVTSEIVDSIGKNVRIKEDSVRSMLKEGILFLLIDDLDYLKQDSRSQLQNFIAEFDRNSFMCVMREKPDSDSFLHDFEPVQVRGWEESTARTYFKNRINDPIKESQLLAELEQFLVFKDPLSPLEASCIVNSFIKDPMNSVVLAPALNRVTKQRILWRYLALTVRTSRVQKDWVVREIGKLALTQFVNERCYFLPVESRVELSQLDELVPELLSKRGAIYSFSHFQYQLMLASMFVDQFQSQAEQIIGDRQMDKFLLKTVPRDMLVDLSKS